MSQIVLFPELFLVKKFLRRPRQAEKVMKKRTIKQEYEGMSWEQVKRTAQNRVRWGKTVELALCSGQSGED